jgi:uncharacterized membrane protein YfhO
MKKQNIYILSFIIPIIIILLIMIIIGYYPFGDKSFLILDGLKQYPGFLSLFMEIIKGNMNAFYSFKGILGFNLFPTLVYYTFNFTNLLSIFFNKINIINFYTLVIILKFGLCGLSMSILLNYLKEDKKSILFSICYALTAYNLLYYCNYMWFDSIILLPIVILGIERIFKEQKYSTYLISLTIGIICNFYMGYMICLFSLIMFFYKLINYHGNKKKIVINFIIYSLLSGLISSFILIPCLLELLNGKALLLNSYAQKYWEFDLDFLTIFYKFTIGSFSNGDLEFGNPNVYVSLFIFINAFLYFFNQKISKKERIISLIIIAIFLLSVSFNLLDCIWQMMQIPIWYPVRYAYIIDLFLIIIAYKNYLNLNINKKKIIITFIIILILIILGFISSNAIKDIINLKTKFIYLGISLIFIIYYLLIINFKDFQKYIGLLLIIELITNTFITFKNINNTNSVKEFNNSIKTNLKVIKKINDSTFYRMTFENKTIKNNGLLLGYNDLNYFSSVRNDHTFTLMNKYFNIHTVDNCNLTYYYNNPIVNALFSVKYYNTNNNITYYKKLNNNTYLNQDATSIGFMTNNNILNLKYHKYLNNINDLVKVINNNDLNIIEELKITDKNVTCNKTTCISNYTDQINYPYLKYETNTKEGFYYLENSFLYKEDLTKYEIYLNNKLISNNIYTPIYTKKNDHLKIIINPNGNEYRDYDYKLYYINNNVYQKFIKNINNNKLDINYQNDNYLEGNIKVINDGILFTSIPNDKGFHVYVDNEEVPKEIILNSLIGIKLKKGNHKITFKYEVPGLKLSLTISLISLLIASFYLNKEKIHAIIKKRKINKNGKEN